MIISAYIGVYCSFRRGFIGYHLPVMISRAEVETGVSTIDIPGAIRYIQATFAGQRDIIVGPRQDAQRLT